MDMKYIISHMWPCWLLGLFMIYTTVESGNKDLLRVEKKPLFKWLFFVSLISVYRIFLFKRYLQHSTMAKTIEAAAQVPWQASLTVFWEDMCHGVPLVLLRRLIGTKWFTFPIHFIAMLVIMSAFGIGHIYQGIIPAIVLSFYIPYSIRIANKFGFGTVILGHMLYDLFTLLVIKGMIGGF